MTDEVTGKQKDIRVELFITQQRKFYSSTSLYKLTANAARDDLLPYFNETIEQLKHFLTPNKDESDQENKLKLQVQAIGR